MLIPRKSNDFAVIMKINCQLSIVHCQLIIPLVHSQFSHRLPLPPCRETFFNNGDGEVFYIFVR